MLYIFVYNGKLETLCFYGQDINHAIRKNDAVIKILNYQEQCSLITMYI